MLILTRKRMDEIKIGQDIVIRVIHTGKGTVKLGIEAPEGVRILRAELTEFPPTSAEPSLETEMVITDEAGQPIVAEAVANDDLGEVELEAAVPLSADKLLNDFESNVPGRSIRRMLQARRQAKNTAAK